MPTYFWNPEYTFEWTNIKILIFFTEGYINESMVSLVSRRYMRGENGTESLVVVFFFKCRSAMALRSVLLIQIGKQNVEIIDK